MTSVCQRCSWKPGRRGWPTHGPEVSDWVAENLINGNGDFFGQALKLFESQQGLLNTWYSRCPKCLAWRYRRALVGEPKGGGKSTLAAALAIVDFCGPDSVASPAADVPIAASSWEQADLIFGTAATMLGGRGGLVQEAPLCGQFDVLDTEIKRCDGLPGRIYRVAAVGGSNDGSLPTLAVFDEVHELGRRGSPRARVHLVISNSILKRRNSRVFNISTAGFDVDDSLLGDLYKHGLEVARNPEVDPGFLFAWSEAPPGLDYRKKEDREVAVRAAGREAADNLWSVEERAARYEDPGVEAHEWIRYYANSWVNVGEDSWLASHPGAWYRLAGEFVPDDTKPFVVAVDMALRRDSVAVVRCENSDDLYKVQSKIWNPNDGVIDHLEVFEYISSISKGPGFRGVVYDPRFFEVIARLLEDRGVEVVQFDQDATRMAPACGFAFDKIVEGKILHTGDTVFSSHVTSAMKRVQDRGFTLSKGRSKRRIDGCIAMCMGLWVLQQVTAAGNPWSHVY